MKQDVLIEKYLQNRLSPDEKRIFEELLEKDVDFKNEVTFQLNLKRVLQKEDEDSFRNLVSDLERKSSKPQSKRFFIMLTVAASIIIFLGLTYFLKISNKPTDNELFAAYFQPYENVIYPIERGSDQQTEEVLAFYTYEEGDYEAAAVLFSQLYNSSKESYYLFYEANALLQSDRASEAIPLLLEHLQSKDVLKEKTKWYLALAYLKEQDKRNAKKYLREVVKDGKYKARDAKKLLKKMN
jgi:hypothetical protein